MYVVVEHLVTYHKSNRRVISYQFTYVNGSSVAVPSCVNSSMTDLCHCCSRVPESTPTCSNCQTDCSNCQTESTSACMVCIARLSGQSLRPPVQLSDRRFQLPDRVYVCSMVACIRLRTLALSCILLRTPAFCSAVLPLAA